MSVRISDRSVPYMQSNEHRRVNIAFAGLTAAGKTTHAKLLATKLGYTYVSATAILLDIVGLSANQERSVWFENLKSIQSKRTTDEIDDELERRLIDIANTSDGLVLDTWALPWIHRAPMIRIWIESDRLSRSWKCFVSQGDKVTHDLVSCTRLIDEKDHSTRSIFLRRHHFDLFKSRNVFDAILDNTHLIDTPSRTAADAGIAAFEPVVTTVVKFLLNDNVAAFYQSVGRWTDEQNRAVIHVNGAPMEDMVG